MQASPGAGTASDRGTQRVLIAAQPVAAALLRDLLSKSWDTVLAHNIPDALAVARGGDIAAIICTIAFDESRMFDFLDAIKRDPRTKGIGFLCCRVLPSVLLDDSMTRLQHSCVYFGATDFIDVVAHEQKFGATAATTALLSAMTNCIRSKV
jgi:CheY-like chemotaxis protein